MSQTCLADRFRPSLIAKAALLIATSWLISTSTFGCETPVHRYALYNWGVGPYWVLALYDSGEEPAEFAQVEKKVAQLASSKPAGANLKWRSINVADPNRLAALPEPVRQLWQSRQNQDRPVYVLVNSNGFLVDQLADPLASLEEWADSPWRRQLADRISKGRAVVLVLLEGVNPTDNERAQEIIDRVIELVDSGNMASVETIVDLYHADSARSETAKTTPISIDSVVLSPDESDEKALVCQLMAVEPDLEKFKGKSMVFSIYGRGRVLAPFIGRGVSEENLINAVRFLTGPCSCEVKDENPGVDLLMKTDWESIADSVAAEDDSQPSKADSGLQYTELTPVDSRSEEDSTPGESNSTGQQLSDMAYQAGVEKSKPSATVASEPVRPSFGKRQLVVLAIGLAVVAVIVFSLGFWLVRRDSR
jgi:hypothetical protein